jgi:F0F1-type ATP synthase beta subunit
MAEYFRDDARQDVLLLDRQHLSFHPGRDRGLGFAGPVPSRVGYQPTLATELAELEERICNAVTGAITSVQAVYVPADDFTDPAAVHTFAHLSAVVVLSRKRASEGLYPAVDLLQSGSKMLMPQIVGEHHFQVAQEVRRTLATYEELKDIIAILGLEELSREDRRIVHRARRLERFLTQPFFTTEAFTGMEGRMVDRDETLDGCERILNDEFADYPERALYMIGSIDEARHEAQTAAADRSPDRREVTKVIAEAENGFFCLLAAPRRFCGGPGPGAAGLCPRGGAGGVRGRGRGDPGQVWAGGVGIDPAMRSWGPTWASCGGWWKSSSNCWTSGRG